MNPWEDEIMLLDPAANLYFKGEFTSTAWAFQKSDEFWACNTPLYSGSLFFWIKIFGYGILQVRMFNVFLITISAILIWLLLKRTSFITSPFRRIVFYISFVFAHGISFICGSGRYDSISILLFSLALYILSIKKYFPRSILLFFVGFLFPIGGLQLIAMTMIIGITAILFFKQKVFKELIYIGSGIFIGIISLLTFYFSKGVLSTFFFSTFGSQHTISGQIGQFLIQNDQDGFVRYSDFFRIFTTDQTLLVLIPICIVIFIVSLKENAIYSNKPILFFLVLGLFMPIGMFVLGKFPLYYSWMAIIPLLIFIFSDRVSIVIQNYNLIFRMVIYTSIIFMIAVGRPAKLFSFENNIKGREIDIEYFNQNFNKKDEVYSDFRYYYELKPRVGMLYTPNYTGSQLLPNYPEAEKVRINKLFIQMSNLDRAVNKIGGEWRQIDFNYGEYFIFERE